MKEFLIYHISFLLKFKTFHEYQKSEIVGYRHQNTIVENLITDGKSAMQIRNSTDPETDRSRTPDDDFYLIGQIVLRTWFVYRTYNISILPIKSYGLF